ncbi:hypothetical protein XA68_14603 [Ophiocordyceps unilateralis]|uniref:Uncharacterized protein n=1 Tax=Ophiocordyceps unilateralis TaxID=268505 RepID=A0A2A9PA76_OPHUN|nr:hypothetical protein XA68_14603 [Ophiocordyceps unilateralis]
MTQIFFYFFCASCNTRASTVHFPMCRIPKCHSFFNIFQHCAVLYLRRHTDPNALCYHSQAVRFQLRECLLSYTLSVSARTLSARGYDMNCKPSAPEMALFAPGPCHLFF